ncbi:MAG TPA: choice-of-anchor X domain-containing protein [Nitrospiria bacterium]|nr:choice-of-anchor X domain-containing protein [Nitrospiria bacterium]
MRKVTALVAVALTAMSCSLAAGQGAGPVILDLAVDPSSGPPGTVYTISVRIESPRDPKAIVPLLYQVREGAEKIEVAIHDDGLDGDAAKGDGRYTGRSVVPDTAAQKTHRFEVFIRDKAGRKSNVLEYRFTVLKGAAI